MKTFKYILIAAATLLLLTFGSYQLLKWFNDRPADAQKLEQKIAKEEKRKEKSDDVKEEAFEEEKQVIKETPKETKKQAEPVKIKEPVKSTVSKTPASNPANAIYHNHEIKYGENLYRIAIRYNTTQQKLIDINGEKAQKLVAGSQIKVPISAEHKVKQGETFSAISDKYNVKISVICLATGIPESTPLKEGMTLIIPLKK